LDKEKLKTVKKKVKIYLTDVLEGRPNVRTMSREIMLGIFDFYKKPSKAEGYREKKLLSDWHRPAWDSGGFQYLMGKLPLSEADPMKTVDIYKKVGVTPKDLPIQLDLPPTYHMPSQDRLGLIHLSAEFYWRMVEEIPYVIPVVHGWTYEELSASLELIEDPDKLAAGSNLATAARNKIGAGAFLQSGRYVLNEAGNLKKKPIGSGAFMNVGGTAVDNVTSNKSTLGVGSFSGAQFPYIVDNVTSNKSFVGAGAWTPALYPWSMGNLNPHSCARDRILDAGGVIASPYPSNADVGWKNTILTNDGMKRKDKKVVSAGTNLPLSTGQTIQKKKEEPKFPPVKMNVIIDRLATVLNMFRDRTLFMLGGGSSHTQHMCFLGGATYSDTSSWRMKGYFGEVLVPEIGARSIGYKDTSKRLKEKEVPIIAECLREHSHPLEGMSVKRFLDIGHMNVTEWYETWEANEWEIKPFPLRALHNAWVLKRVEEPIANEYANDPDRYYKYLKNKRFKGRPNLTRNLDKLWERLKGRYVQAQMGIYLKGGKKGIMA